jgi:hypothetical protein
MRVTMKPLEVRFMKETRALFRTLPDAKTVRC